MAHMAYKSYSSLPHHGNVQTTPLCPKHSTVNLRNEPLIRNTLDTILSLELAGATFTNDSMIDEIFMDNALGFEIAPITQAVVDLHALDHVEVTPNPPPPNTFPMHDRCNISSEPHTAHHLNKLNTLIGRHGGWTTMRKWTAAFCDHPLPGSTHQRKPDIVLCNTTISDEDLDWKLVHSIIEITANSKFHPPYMTLRCKALNIFSAQHSRRYVITAWMMHTKFGAILFNRSGEIRARWSYTSHESYVRLLAGLAYGSEELLGYDLSLKRSPQGTVQEVKLNNEWYSILSTIFSSDVLQGRATVCYLVLKGDKQLVVKDTWVDIQHQYKEQDFYRCAPSIRLRMWQSWFAWKN
jgi:hypothetical protein